MGVRGLTTFIAKNSDKYLERYKLYNTYLVIDGYNIASHLYKWHCTRNDCFGGDYDKYAKTVREFFDLLKECNVTPIIVFDGGYENKKLKTVYTRMKNKINVARDLTSVTQGSITLFPLFMRDLFTDIVNSLGLKVVRCDFEADYELACLARTLEAPVLSYDSDFYIFDVLYIPFSTMELCSAKLKNSSGRFINCRIYKIEHFLNSYGGLQKCHLPLLAVLLGNDYIKKSVFSNFYAHIKLSKRKNLETSQQRKIAAVIKWLRNETGTSAVMKILGRLKLSARNSVATEIKFIADGYCCTTSKLLPYLNLDIPTNILNNEEMKIDPIVVTSFPDEGIETCEVSEEDSDACSDTSSCESYNSNVYKLGETTTEQVFNDDFKQNFHKCVYPSFFADMLFRNTYFCTPQLECYSEQCSHYISADIISAIHTILKSDNSKHLIFVTRNEKSGIKNNLLPHCKLQLPKFSDLPNLPVTRAKQILLDVLNVKAQIVLEFVESLPSSCQLYYLSLIFWVNTVSPKVNHPHIYSLILCTMLLNKVDNKIGFYRSTSKFSNKFECKINTLLKNIQTDKESINSNFSTLLNNVSEEESLLCMYELISYFQMEPKMRTQQKLFNIQIIHSFAQFQSCLLHIKYLNILLLTPFEDFIISDFYDGTFLFNMCNNLLKRNDVNAYLDILLKNCPCILSICKQIGAKLFSCLSDNLEVAKQVRKKHKKQKIKSEYVDEGCIGMEIQINDDYVDMNNRFSLLNYVNK